MEKLRCIAVDDEPLALRMIEMHAEKVPYILLEKSFTDPVEALSAITDDVPHLVFLDIQMPDLDGMEFAKKISHLDTRIIFTTAFKHYAYESYEVWALDFLLKPIRFQKFLGAVEKGRDWFTLKEAAQAVTDSATGKASHVFIRVGGGMQKVALSDIVYVEGMKDYVMIYVEGKGKPFVSHITMKSMDDILPSSLFLRIHRSYIVALDRIDSIQPDYDIEIGGKLLHISDGYKASFDRWLRSNIVI